MDSTEELRRLVNAVKPVYTAHRERIEQLKSSASHWAATDFIWEALLLSLSTMGNVRGGELFNNSLFHDQVRFAALLPLTADERLATLRHCLRNAKVRMPDRKAGWLRENFDRIQREGGPEAVRQKLIDQPGRDGKIQYLRTFRGIGKKYSRNMMMDVYHEDFHDAIAIDDRIKKVLAALDLEFDDHYYEKAEHFLLDAAHGAGLNGCELDRLLFGYLDEVLTAIEKTENTN